MAFLRIAKKKFVERALKNISYFLHLISSDVSCAALPSADGNLLPVYHPTEFF